jgi:RNA polymerase sigma-70 factor (ECF subfamily)
LLVAHKETALGHFPTTPCRPNGTGLSKGGVMSETDPVPDAVRRLQDGDPQSADALFALYAWRLTRVAERQLSDKLAGRVDGEDVVQSVFRTFFRRGAAGEFRVDSSAQLWRLLLTITLRKVAAHARHHTTQGRDVAAEAGGDDWLAAAVAREPGPEEAAVFVDQVETLLRGLPPLFCQVLELRLQGCGSSEVARRLGVSRMTVHRALSLLKRRLEAASGA